VWHSPATRPAATVMTAAVGVGLLAVVCAVLAAVLGLLGPDPVDGLQGLRATVIRAVPCAGSGREAVEYRLNGVAHEADFDGCGHQTGEELDVLVTGAAGATVVTAAGASTGSDSGGRSAAALLLTVAGLAGAVYPVLLRLRGTGSLLPGALPPLTSVPEPRRPSEPFAGPAGPPTEVAEPVVRPCVESIDEPPAGQPPGAAGLP